MADNWYILVCQALYNKQIYCYLYMGQMKNGQEEGQQFSSSIFSPISHASMYSTHSFLLMNNHHIYKPMMLTS